MNKTLCLLVSVLLSASALGQGVADEKASIPRGKTFMLRLKNDKGLNPGRAASPDMRQMLSLKKEDVLQLVHERDDAGVHHQKYKQYSKGIPVEYGTVSTLSRRGVLESLSGEIYDIPDDLSPVPSMAESAAFETALNFLHAQKMEQPPKGELVYVRVYLPNGSKKKHDIALAYKFNIYQQEVPARHYVFVDAHEGVVIHKDAILKHAAAPADTRYSGRRMIATTQDATRQTWVLKDNTRGLGIETYNLNKSIAYDNAIPFSDADNQWTAGEFDNGNKDNAALDAHWGAMMTYDYFKVRHGRDSYDDQGAKIISYVHYSRDYVNAFWNGSVMTYGDGSGHIDPLTALDICGHEIAHAVCSATANLVYLDESGALNEGLSDIWGAMIQHYATPEKSIWELGEDIHTIFRSMSDPNAYQQPDTYAGEFWYTGLNDDGGVHVNSGVLNHWYYILVTGKTGTNDHGTDYNVQGIGLESAARIVYDMETHHLTPNAMYIDARVSSLQAAEDLFGPQSNEYRQVVRAWDAVGVYDADIFPPSALAAHAVSISSVALSWEDHSADETSFIVERSIHLNRDFTPVKVTGANETAYTDDGLSEGIYYYRVKAMLPDGRSTQPTAVVAVALNVNPLILSATEVTACNKIFLDPGGLEDYQDHQDITMVIYPAETGKKVQISFSSFALASTEFESDQLEIFDGDDIRSAQRIGTYSRKSLPADVNATTASGALTFHFVSRSTAGFGWQAQLACVTMPETPANLVATAASGTQINLDWEDLATTETGYRVERGIPPFAPFREIAMLPANTTHYEQAGLRTDNAFTYRVQALDGTVYSGHSNAATAVIGRDPLLMRPGTFSTCGAVFLDPAGGEGYYDTTFVNMTLRPSIPGTKVAITFSEFDLGENQFDRLAVINSRVVNWYGKTEIPPRIVSYDDDGSLRLEFSSGFGGAHGKGWRAEIACLTPPASPTNLIAMASGDNQVHLTWVDHADDETDYTVERAVNDGFFVTVASLEANAQTYDDTGLITGVPYTYRVWAEINDDLFSRSNESTVTLVVDPPVVDPPLAVESNPDDSFIVRPNPASETIHITSEVYNISLLSLIDVLGRTCLEATPLRADYVLEIRTLSPGIYTLLIQTGNSISATRRIQIIR